MGQSNFLPEDYVAERAERRSSLLSLTLFAVVMTAVVAAFFVTNRQHARVKIEQREINTRYAEAARSIEELEELEHQKMQLLDRAEVAAALVERIPRSILLAELINRMPDAVSLQEFNVESERQRVRKAPVTASKVKSVKSTGRKPTKADEEEERKVEVPVYLVAVEMEGVAPTNQHVAQYLSNLNKCSLLKDVELRFSKDFVIEDHQVRQFRIRALLAPNADARHFEPLKLRRELRNPLDDDAELDGGEWDTLDIEMDDEQDGGQ